MAGVSLLTISIFLIVACAVIYIIQQVPGVPPFLIKIIWVLVAVVAAIFAIKFLFSVAGI